MIRKHQHRGFTLVELLVAAALAMLIMAVLSTAFSMGMGTISQLKATGDLADRLRTAEVLLRSDLDSEHFDSDGGRLNVSDLKFDPTTRRPTGGYFAIQSSPLQVINEGTDTDGFVSTRADINRNHVIAMTVKRTGQGHSEFFGANTSGTLTAQSESDALGGGQDFAGQWAEVRWFLANPVNIGGVQTFTLYRRVWSMGQTAANAPTGNAALLERLSTRPGTNPGVRSINRPQDVITLTNRASFQDSILTTPQLANPNNVGSDIVLTNVLSFEVKPYYTRGTSVLFNNSPASPSLAQIGQDYPFSDPGFQNSTTGNYDSNTSPVSATAGQGRRLLAVMVKIRVYEPKNKLTRQVTLIVKL